MNLQNKSNKTLISLSIILNIFFILFFGILVVKNWTVGNLKQKITSVYSGENKEKKQTYSSYYLEKNNQFEKFKINNNSIVFLGDSITDMGAWNEIFNDINIKNRGIIGDNIDGVLNRLDSIINGKPKKIFLMIGTNDLPNNKDIKNLSGKYEKIILQIKEKSPNTQIYVQSILPINSSLLNTSDLINKKETNNDILKLNNCIEQLSEKYNIVYINLYNKFLDTQGSLNKDITADGIHLNGQGYLIWKQAIEQYVN